MRIEKVKVMLLILHDHETIFLIKMANKKMDEDDELLCEGIKLPGWRRWAINYCVCLGFNILIYHIMTILLAISITFIIVQICDRFAWLSSSWWSRIRRRRWWWGEGKKSKKCISLRKKDHQLWEDAKRAAITDFFSSSSSSSVSCHLNLFSHLYI